MPQMAPILWLNLLIIFLITYLAFMVMNFYISIPEKMLTKKSKMIVQEKPWKW
uniref:ATP synthase complex subunit 8 n=1 Tax=Clibanarius infraspinatus TaxID=1566627 RepID=A0A0A1IXE2_9EUCA|nr:ATP synthase F0 subunit 8 [Clibanarius infraspinatus]CEH27540.1 ATP synthase F0 subunit 8 [Clibanarius infraspinatus]